MCGLWPGWGADPQGKLPIGLLMELSASRQNAPLDLPALDADTARQIGELFTSPELDAWSESLARVKNCSHPVRPHGSSQTVDVATGTILSVWRWRSGSGTTTRRWCCRRTAT